MTPTMPLTAAVVAARPTSVALRPAPKPMRQPESAIQLGKHGADLHRIGNVTGDRHRSPAQRDDFARGPLHAGGVAVSEHEIGARLGQGERHGPAQPLGSAGDKADAPREIE